MKKFLVTFLILSLVIVPIFANPRGYYSNWLYLPLVFASVLTLGTGWGLFNAFTIHDKVEFKSEEIEISINEDNSIDVCGIYHFSRTGKKVSSYNIRYPFPDQKEYGKVMVNSVKVNNQDIEYFDFEVNNHDRISFELVFGESDDCDLEVNFTQYPESSTYKYILETTKYWKKALERTEITVNMSEDIELSSNYEELEKVIFTGIESKYIMVMEDFYPEEDLVIFWHQQYE